MQTTTSITGSQEAESADRAEIAEARMATRHPLPGSRSTEIDRSLVDRLTTFFQPPSDVL